MPLVIWKNVLWSDESKFCRLRPPNMLHNPKYTSKTIKHGRGNVMAWVAFSGHGVGPICKIDTRMDQYVYWNIVLNTMMSYAEHNISLRWSFMHDNEPKHSSLNVLARGQY